MKLQGQKSFPNTEAGYQEAEKFADEWAGDNMGYAAVVEDYENDQLHVMDRSEVEGFLVEWYETGTHPGYNPQAIYFADHRLRCHACEKYITGQRISARGRHYCSFACLDKSG